MVYFKKIVIIACCTLFFVFTTFIAPHQEASAHPLALAVPTGITVSAGAYTTGAWALAATLGALGYVENQEAINAHALKVWNTSNQLSQDSMNWMIGQSLTLGNGAVNMVDGFLDWYLGEIPSLAMTATGATVSGDYSVELENFIAANASLTRSADTVDLSRKFNQEPWLIVNGKTTWGIQVTYNSYQKKTFFSIRARDAYGSGIVEEVARLEGRVSLGEGYSVKEFIAYAAAVWGVSITPFASTVDLPANYPDVLSSFYETWRGMKDAGLVLPVEDAIPSINGQALRYNPTADTYTFPSGKLYDGSTGDITWTFPQPRVVTDTLTGNPTVAIPTTKPAVDGSIPRVRTGTWTDVFTNTTITSDLEVPIEGDIPVTPGQGLAKPTKKISFVPLMLVSDTLKDKFPFSIPFDFLKQLNIFDVSPVAPKIEVDMPLSLPGGFNVPASFDIDFKMFDKVAVMSRWFTVIVFDIGLILAIRRLMPD